MKQLLFTLFICWFFEASYSQTSCPARFIESKFKQQYFPTGDALSQEYLYIGMQKESIVEEDRYTQGDQSFIYSANSNLKQANAYPFVYNAIRKNDIVILNERHNRGINRAFLYSLLDSLKSLKVDALFIETLAYVNDDSIYAKTHKVETWGLYMAENVFRQVAHKIARLNIPLYSYEVGPQNQLDTVRIKNKLYLINKTDALCKPIEMDTLLLSRFFSKDDDIQREAEQAIHIYQKIVKFNIRKAFIYCGYAHAWKTNNTMAGLLVHLLKKNVYSIDQILLNEHSAIKYEDPLYTKYEKGNNFFVLLDSLNNPLHTLKLEGVYKSDEYFDIAVGTPRDIYKNNRPSYLELGGDRKRYPLSKFINTKTYKTDFLTVIYDESEYETNTAFAIPEDAFQVINESTKYDAILIPGKIYHLFIYQNGARLLDKIIEIVTLHFSF